jgi:hypothetical protein
VYNGLLETGRQRSLGRAEDLPLPEFRREASTRDAARAGVLAPGSHADQVVRTVVENFVGDDSRGARTRGTDPDAPTGGTS